MVHFESLDECSWVSCDCRRRAAFWAFQCAVSDEPRDANLAVPDFRSLFLLKIIHFKEIVSIMSLKKKKEKRMK